MKTTTLLNAVFLFFAAPLFSQPTNTPICPDFTAEDIHGNQWNLYAMLNSGKRVVLNLFYAGNESSWSYYQSKELQRLDSLYGSLGTGEIQILFIEAESLNTEEQLHGPANSSTNPAVSSQGDWVSDNPFPIIDDASLGELLQMDYSPKLYYICPDRLKYPIGQYSMEQLEAAIMQPSCVPASFSTDPMIAYVNTLSHCDDQATVLMIGLKNFGTQPLILTTLELTDGEMVYPIPWTGHLATYETEELLVGPLDLGYKRHFNLLVTSEDENPDNSTISLEAGVPLGSSTVRLELLYDAWPSEVSWRIMDDEGVVLAQNEGSYLNYQLVEKDILLPGDGCYRFEISDSEGDGLQGTIWGGFDGRCSLKSYNWQNELVYTLFDYDGSYPYFTLTTDFEVNDDIALGTENNTPNSIPTLVEVFPNPTSSDITLRYSLESAADVAISLSDITGRPVRTPLVQHLPQGKYQEQLPLHELPSGIYFLKLQYDQYQKTMRIVKR